MGIKSIKIFEEAQTFDAALALAVQIVEKEGLLAPKVEISPKWILTNSEDEEDEVSTTTMTFDVMVMTTLDSDSNKEILDPSGFDDL